MSTADDHVPHRVRRHRPKRPSPGPVVRWYRATDARAQRVVDAITAFSGSLLFVVLHCAWFAFWITYNLVAGTPFDPFPFGLLTLVVSLEAIFLSTFVLITQNKQSDATDRREQEDLSATVYAETLSELIAARLGITQDEVQARYEQQLRADQGPAPAGGNS